MSLYVGIDLGTSGCRAIAIDRDGAERARARGRLAAPRRRGAAVEQEPEQWWDAVAEALGKLCARVPAAAIEAIAVDGTSGTVLLADADGHPLGPALMYNDGRATEEAALIARHAPAESAAHGTASGLAKLLWLLRHGDGRGARVHTQADWITARLCGRRGVCDTNNALKLGYDPVSKQWPPWLDTLGLPRDRLPTVVRPGTPIATLDPPLTAFGLSPATLVAAGTTDSTAAFMATGACQPGDAVTSLGSTLVVKVLSRQPVFAPEYGVYSQPLGELWLAGGGSNSGGAVLREFFSDRRMAELSPRLDPEHDTGLDYYPLGSRGERFPVNDPELEPRITPRPADEVVFFQALLEGIARIERRGYALLAELGAPSPRSVRTVGGGAANPAWTRMRQRMLGVPMLKPRHGEAAYGAALLARRAALATGSPTERN